MKRSNGLSVELCVLIALVGCKRPSPGEQTPINRLSLPGWEDVQVGKELPADARQSCTDKDVDGSQLPAREKVCKGCRSAQLLTPCIEVMTFDDVHADAISARLPDEHERSAKIVDALHARWGTATSRGGTPRQLEWEQWTGPHEQVMLSTSYVDFSGCTAQELENNTKCGRFLQQPRITVVISEPSTQPAAAASTPPADPPKRREYDFGSKECGGTTVVQLLAALKFQNFRAPPARTCIYEVGVLSVVSLTQDGWTMATISSLGGAFRSDRPYIEGAIIRDRRAIFLGVEPFNMVNGTGQNIATFELTDDAAPQHRAAIAMPEERAPNVVATPRAVAGNATVETVQRLINDQAASFARDTASPTTGHAHFAESFAADAVAFFPHVLAPYEGRSKIAGGVPSSWSTATRVDTSAVTVGVYGSTAWATTQWRITDGGSHQPMLVRVTEVLSLEASGPLVVAASFSLPVHSSSGLPDQVSGFADGIAPSGEPVTWLIRPADLASNVDDESAASIFGSDANEIAIGADGVRSLLSSWKRVRLDFVGNVRVIDLKNTKIVMAFARWDAAKPTLFRVLSLFVPNAESKWTLATVHYSVLAPLN